MRNSTIGQLEDLLLSQSFPKCAVAHCHKLHLAHNYQWTAKSYEVITPHNTMALLFLKGLKALSPTINTTTICSAYANPRFLRITANTYTT